MFQLARKITQYEWCCDMNTPDDLVIKFIKQLEGQGWQLSHQSVVNSKLSLIFEFEYVVPPHKNIFREV